MPINWLGAYTNTYGDAGDLTIALITLKLEYSANRAQPAQCSTILRVISKFDLEFVIIHSILYWFQKQNNNKKGITMKICFTKEIF